VTVVGTDLAARCLTFVWEQDPDLAVEAGRLPPRLWEDVSLGQRDAVLDAADALIAELAAQPDIRPLEVARYHVACARSLVARRGIGMLNHMTGPASRLSWAAESWPVAADPGAEVYLERLRAFPAYCRDLVREGARWPEPGSRPVLEAFVSQLDALVEAQRSTAAPLLRPLTEAGRAAPPDLLDRLLAALLELRSFAVAALASAHPASPLPELADGPQRYAEATYRGTSRSLSPGRLEAIGQGILSRSQPRFDRLRDSGEVTFQPMSSGAEYLERAVRAHARLVTALPAVCSRLPRMPCEVVAMPAAHAAVGPPAYYGPSSHRNNRPGQLYVNTAAPTITRSWEVLPLAMHEGVPGHHLQLALLDENESIHETLRLLSVNAFTEGWAVYAETLAPELGLDLTPVDEFGLLAHQRWRAARLVTDVGLHVRGWSLDRAVAFMAGCTGLDRDAVRREVVRYVAWPGQALGYTVGAETVAAWVAGRRATGVPLADAHAELLALGSVPLSVLAPPTD
jgi:uncharacterized protein (DUF885 family)